MMTKLKCLIYDRAFFKNCRLLGFQDTLYTYGKQSRQYYEDCYIEGTVDFIFGWSTAVFNRCHIHSKRDGYVTAPSTDQGKKYGYVFYDCKLTASPEAKKVYLSRPWRPYAQAVFVRCELGQHVLPEGWNNWGKKENEKTAFYAEYDSRGEGANPKAFKYIMWITGIVFILIAPENGSTAMLLFGVVFLMMIIGRVPWKQLLKLISIVGVIAVIFIGMIMVTPAKQYRDIPMMHRVETWQNRIKGFFEDKEAVPAAKYDIDKNAQIAHANIAIASSNIIGKMPGNSVQRDFLSQAFSDFIFAIVIEELGLLGGGFVVVLYIWLLMRAGKIARKSEKAFPAFLVMGIAILLVSQAMLNMMVAVGLFPVTGQPLPLISKGGTSTLINCAYIGMILSVSRYVAEKEEQKKQEEETTAEVKLQAATQILLEHARGLVTAEAAGKPENEDTLSEVSESIPTDETIPTEASENNKSV